MKAFLRLLIVLINITIIYASIYSILEGHDYRTKEEMIAGSIGLITIVLTLSSHLYWKINTTQPPNFLNGLLFFSLKIIINPFNISMLLGFPTESIISNNITGVADASLIGFFIGLPSKIILTILYYILIFKHFNKKILLSI